MAEIKLTKNELRTQQTRLLALQKYLPTLQLKKAMLQSEVQEARLAFTEREKEYETACAKVQTFDALIKMSVSVNLDHATKVKEVQKRYENIAGVEVPFLASLTFNEVTYSLFDTPIWIDSLILWLKKVAEAKVHIDIALERIDALKEELRDVSIKVNLFEKNLIPRALKNIRKIKVFLGDQQLAAVSQAKVAKQKIEERKALAALQRIKPTEIVHAD